MSLTVSSSLGKLRGVTFPISRYGFRCEYVEVLFVFRGQQDRLVVPRGWLNYVAPEILQVLSPVPSNSECMDCYPYTFQSDIYAFG